MLLSTVAGVRFGSLEHEGERRLAIVIKVREMPLQSRFDVPGLRLPRVFGKAVEFDQCEFDQCSEMHDAFYLSLGNAILFHSFANFLAGRHIRENSMEVSPYIVGVEHLSEFPVGIPGSIGFSGQDGKPHYFWDMEKGRRVVVARNTKGRHSHVDLDEDSIVESYLVRSNGEYVEGRGIHTIIQEKGITSGDMHRYALMIGQNNRSPHLFKTSAYAVAIATGIFLFGYALEAAGQGRYDLSGLVIAAMSASIPRVLPFLGRQINRLPVISDIMLRPNLERYIQDFYD